MDMLDFYIASRSSQAQLLQRSYTTCVVGLLHGYMRQRFVFDVLKRWEKWAGWKGPRGEGVVFGFAPWQWVFHLWSCQHAFCAKLFATSFKCRRFCSLPVLLPCSRWLFPTTSWKIIFGDKLVRDPGHTYPTLSYYIWFREPSSIPPFCVMKVGRSRRVDSSFSPVPVKHSVRVTSDLCRWHLMRMKNERIKLAKLNRPVSKE